jgi:hypothetical protein
VLACAAIPVDAAVTVGAGDPGTGCSGIDHALVGAGRVASRAAVLDAAACFGRAATTSSGSDARRPTSPAVALIIKPPTAPSPIHFKTTAREVVEAPASGAAVDAAAAFALSAAPAPAAAVTILASRGRPGDSARPASSKSRVTRSESSARSRLGSFMASFLDEPGVRGIE